MRKLAVIESDQPVTQEFLKIVQSWTNGDAARFLDSAARRLENQNKLAFVELGLICKHVEDRKLWGILGFRSFDDWITNACPSSRSSGYEAKTALNNLADVPFSDLQSMSRENIRTLSKMSTGSRKSPELIAAAKSQGGREFIRTIQSDFPNQHIEGRKRIVWFLPESTESLMEDAIKLAMKVGECESREEALLEIATDYLNNNHGWA